MRMQKMRALFSFSGHCGFLRANYDFIKKNIIFLIYFSLFSGSALLVSCGAPKDEPAFTPVYTILSSACIQCHQPGGSATANYGVSLDFTTQASAYSTLLAGNVSASTTSTICSGVKIVSAGSPSSSYLLGTVVSTYNVPNFAGKTGCTPSNHNNLYGINLSSAQQTTLINWVQSGATN